ncbi:MAG: hypothetical protein V4819_22720 [Verrucomicrobiota bacterium]
MNTTLLAGLTGILASLVFSSACRASAVGTSSVQQPVNLGGRADPSRIPLGRVPVICNYSYGRLGVIDEPRPCPLDPLSWAGGSEFNQNLANVSGIWVQEGDLGKTPKDPVIIHLKPWKVPAYSPYSKEQVIAATLWCVIHAAGGRPDNPLQIRIVAEAPEDKFLESKFPTKYVTVPGEDGKPVPPVEISGTRIETDARGIPWVVFTDVKPAVPPADFPQPTMVPFKNWATETDENSGFDFFPVWGNGGKAENPLELVFSSANLCYRVFNSHGRQEANQLILDGYPGSCDASSDETGSDVFIGHPNIPQETLTAALRALILTALPTAERPLRFRMVLEESRRSYFPAFLNLPRWTELKDKPGEDYFTLECAFVWDPEKQALLKGTFPPELPEAAGKAAGPRNADTVYQEEKLREMLADKVKDMMERGIADGTLQPPPELTRSGPHPAIDKALASAGYHAGLASCANPVDPWQLPVSNPLRLEDGEMSEAHRLGWNAGRARGLDIIQAARKELSEKKPDE